MAPAGLHSLKLEQSLRLLLVEPDFASAIDDPARRRSAARQVTAGRLNLVPGERLDPDKLTRSAPFGIVVLSGYLVREWMTARRTSADLIGGGDVVPPAGGEPTLAMLHHTTAWTALTDVRVALLDAEFFERAAPWPEIAGALLERTGRVGQRLSLRGAIAALPSVDARLLASFWLWASQWGSVASQGVVLRVPLSHERLARLIQARRPTVTTALGRLRRSHLIAHRRDGSWVLRAPGEANGRQGTDGVAMPILDELLAYTPSVRRPSTALTSGDSRTVIGRELRARLAEQREALRVAAKHHEEMLERLRHETDRLKNAGGPPGVHPSVPK